MRVGVVRVVMSRGFVPVTVAVLRLCGSQLVVAVLMVLVVRMFVIVFQGFVHVLMAVVLGQVQPDANSH